ncbi:hypothetical protein AU194_08230 [Mycobacterium sp. GA-2829]|nr:hypothetical protein AU194_08230 [Mycobacterium sp. GA-2829]
MIMLSPTPSGDTSAEPRAWIARSAFDTSIDVESLPARCVRVEAGDLRAAGRRAVDARERARPVGTDPVPVVVDVYALVADTAAQARSAFARLDAVSTVGVLPSLLYVGTAAGLRGLITDLHTCGIADGAMLLPLPADRSSDLADEIATGLGLVTAASAGAVRP